MHKLIASVLTNAVLIATPSHAGSRQQATILLSPNPEDARAQQEWGYADAVVSGDTIYLSGVVVWLGEDGNIDAAFIRAFEQIGETLKRAGASWDDVLEATSYHTDLTTQLQALTRAKKQFIRPPVAAWTVIEVSRLIPNRGIAEIRVIARKSSPISH